MSPRKLLSARAAARNKPEIVRCAPPGEVAAADRAYDAAIARAGMLRVGTLQTCCWRPRRCPASAPTAANSCILSNGSGAAALAAAAARRAGLRLASLQPTTLQAVQPLLARPGLPGAPLLMRADATPAEYAEVLQRLATDAAEPALLLIHAPGAAVAAAQVARAAAAGAAGAATADGLLARPRRGGRGARRVFQQAGMPSYATPEEAVSAFSMLVAWPQPGAVDRGAAEP